MANSQMQPSAESRSNEPGAAPGTSEVFQSPPDNPTPATTIVIKGGTGSSFGEGDGAPRVLKFQEELPGTAPMDSDDLDFGPAPKHNSQGKSGKGGYPGRK